MGYNGNPGTLGTENNDEPSGSTYCASGSLPRTFPHSFHKADSIFNITHFTQGNQEKLTIVSRVIKLKAGL